MERFALWPKLYNRILNIICHITEYFYLFLKFTKVCFADNFCASVFKYCCKIDETFLVNSELTRIPMKMFKITLSSNFQTQNFYLQKFWDVHFCKTKFCEVSKILYLHNVVMARALWIFFFWQVSFNPFFIKFFRPTVYLWLQSQKTFSYQCALLMSSQTRSELA